MVACTWQDRVRGRWPCLDFGMGARGSKLTQLAVRRPRQSRQLWPGRGLPRPAARRSRPGDERPPRLSGTAPSARQAAPSRATRANPPHATLLAARLRAYRRATLPAFVLPRDRCTALGYNRAPRPPCRVLHRVADGGWRIGGSGRLRSKPGTAACAAARACLQSRHGVHLATPGDLAVRADSPHDARFGHARSSQRPAGEPLHAHPSSPGWMLKR